MKILLVSPLPPPSGGMARWTQLYLSECSKHEIDVTVVNSNLSAKRARSKKRSFNYIDEVKRARRIIKDIKKSIRLDRPDIIHICSPCSRYGLIRDLFCLKYAKNIPVIFHCHCNIEDQASSKLSRIILRRIVLRSKKVIVLNRDSKKIIDIIEDNKAILIPNFIEDSNVRSEHTISRRLKSVVYVGHVKIKKGINEIFMAASKSKDIEFIVVGPIQELPEGIKQPSNVMLTGEVNHDQVASFMEKADVFLFPSYTEGFANVMLEAMASGLPIIASDVGANKELIEDQGGIIVPPKEYEPIISALAVLEDPKIRSEMSYWNIEKVRSHYTLSKVIPIIKRCYEVSV